METSKGITVSSTDIEEFFSGISAVSVTKKELTDKEKQIIIHAYENGYNKDAVAKKLKVNPKKMKSYYEEYKAGKKIETRHIL